MIGHIGNGRRHAAVRIPMDTSGASTSTTRQGLEIPEGGSRIFPLFVTTGTEACQKLFGSGMVGSRSPFCRRVSHPHIGNSSSSRIRHNYQLKSLPC